VAVDRERATYSLQDGEAFPLVHYEESVTVASDKPVTLPIPRITPRPAPSQPPGRAPARRAGSEDRFR
jgi:alpha,alpha-trehalose phosphorylase